MKTAEQTRPALAGIIYKEDCEDMGAENVFQENQEYLIKARELVVSIDDMEDELNQTKTMQKKVSRSLSQEEKGLSDEISSTLKNRKNEIEDGYDVRLSDNGAKIRQLQSQKDKKKTERMGNRIENETASLNESNRQLKLEARELFKQNHVSAFCNSEFFYCMFAPRGFAEILKLVAFICLFCLGVPAVVSVILSYTVFADDINKLVYVVIGLAIVLFEFILYFVIYNAAKIRNLDVVREGRQIRDKVKANDKQIRAIRNSITKDKDESVYNLGKYDEKLKQLEDEREDISNRKIEAIKVFENETKAVIISEINGRRQPKIDSLKEELKSVEEKIAAMESNLADMRGQLTDGYVTFLGKDLCTEEKLTDLISIMEEGTASTVSGAIEVYKGEN